MCPLRQLPHRGIAINSPQVDAADRVGRTWPKKGGHFTAISVPARSFLAAKPAASSPNVCVEDLELQKCSRLDDEQTVGRQADLLCASERATLQTAPFVQGFCATDCSAGLIEGIGFAVTSLPDRRHS